METKPDPYWQPLSPGNISNPYPFYQKLRDEQPVYKAKSGEYIISRYQDIKSILRDKKLLVGNKFNLEQKQVDYLRSKNISLDHIGPATRKYLLFLNPPDHTFFRKIIIEAWDDRAIEDAISGHINTLIYRLRERDSFDIIHDFARHLPAMAISDILGIPMDDYEMLMLHAKDLIRAVDLYLTLDDLQKIDASAAFFLSYFEKLIQEKKATPGEDLISKIIKKGGNQLKDEDLLSLCNFLFIAGEETTVNLLSVGLYHLLQHPESAEQLKRKPELWPSAIEELLRYDGPVHFLGRIAGEDISLNDVYIPKGSTLTLCIGSANRDEKQFAGAEALDIHRAPNPHLSFGHGIHYCLGDWLARIQARLAFRKLFEEFPGMSLKSGELEWQQSLSIRGLKRLEIYKNL